MKIGLAALGDFGFDSIAYSGVQSISTKPAFLVAI